MYSHTQKIAIQKMLVFFYTHKKYYVIHAKITSIFTIQKLLCSAPIQKLPYKRLPYIFSHTKITMYYTHKNCHTFLLCIFSHTKITMYYTQKITYKKMLVFFPYKNYYVVHTQKITYKKLPYKNLLCILTHKNCHTKNVSVFLYTQKILCNPRKNY